MNRNEHPQPVQTLHGASPQPYDGSVIVTPKKPGNLMRLCAVVDRVSLAKSSIYAGVKAGTFPAPYRLSARAVGWREEDLDRWICERVKVGSA